MASCLLLLYHMLVNLPSLEFVMDIDLIQMQSTVDDVTVQACNQPSDDKGSFFLTCGPLPIPSLFLSPPLLLHTRILRTFTCESGPFAERREVVRPLRPPWLRACCELLDVDLFQHNAVSCGLQLSKLTLQQFVAQQ